MTHRVLSLRTDYEAHLAKDVLTIMIDIMMAGFDGDEPNGTRTLAAFIEERDAAASALAEAALERGRSAHRSKEIASLITRMWNEHPSVKEWLDREYALHGKR